MKINFKLCALSSILIVGCIESNAVTQIASNNDQNLTANNTEHYAFFTQADKAPEGYIQCSVTSSGFNKCGSLIPIIKKSEESPHGIAIYKNYAYFTSPNVSGYIQCQIDSSGIQQKSCHSVSVLNLFSPQYVITSNDFAYFINGFDNPPVQCSIGSLGIEAETCKPLDIPADSLEQIVYGNGYAYFTLASNINHFYQCSVDKLGIEANSCTDGDLNDPQYNYTSVAVDDKHIYFLDTGNGVIKQCTLSSNNQPDLSNCAIENLPYKGTGSQQSIVLNNGIAYILNSSGNNMECPVDASGIKADSCTKIDNSQLQQGLSDVAFW